MAVFRVLATVFAVAACFAFSFFAPAGASVPLKMLSVEQQQEDFYILRTALEGAHGGLYRYSTKAEIDAQFDAIEQSLTAPASEAAFFRKLPPLIDAIHDGHTNIRPSKEFRGYLINSEKRFPFDIRYVDGRAFVEKNFSEEQTIRPGAEMLAINGRDMAGITKTLMMAVGTDGYIETSKYFTLNRLFWLLYAEHIDTSGDFEIVIASPLSDAPLTYEVAGVPAEILLNDMRAKEFTEAPLALRIDESESVAVMRIATFTDMSTPVFFENSFKTLRKKKVQNLIIDIRNNSGGYDKFNTDLFDYLVDRPYKFYDGFTYRITDESVLNGAHVEPDSFFYAPELTGMSKEERRRIVEESSFMELLADYAARNPAAGLHYPAENRFIGDVYLLFDGGSGSSGGEAPALMHQLGVGTLIGEEANGAYQGVTAGVLVPFELPHSGARLRIPLMAYHNAVAPGVFEGRGAPPDYPVVQTLEDAINGVDTAMEFTRKLIRKRNPAQYEKQ